MSKQIEINFDFESKYLRGLIEINSDDLELFYAQDDTFRGLQCDYVGGSEEYEKVTVLCMELSQIVEELNEILNKKIMLV